MPRKSARKFLGCAILSLSGWIGWLSITVLVPLHQTWRIPRQIINKWDELSAGLLLAAMSIAVMLLAIPLLANPKK